MCALLPAASARAGIGSWEIPALPDQALPLQLPRLHLNPAKATLWVFLT